MPHCLIVCKMCTARQNLGPHEQNTMQTVLFHFQDAPAHKGAMLLNPQLSRTSDHHKPWRPALRLHLQTLCQHGSDEANISLLSRKARLPVSPTSPTIREMVLRRAQMMEYLQNVEIEALAVLRPIHPGVHGTSQHRSSEKGMYPPIRHSLTSQLL